MPRNLGIRRFVRRNRRNDGTVELEFAVGFKVGRDFFYFVYSAYYFVYVGVFRAAFRRVGKESDSRF